MDALVETLRHAVGPFRLDLLGGLLLAALLGGLIGWEREVSGKPAGLRTNMLICIGAALLGDVSIHFAAMTPSGLVRADPARIAAQIVSGIGFLGAGTIIQARGSVTGLTTAATLWVVAAIGLAVGGGMYVAALGTAALVLIALAPLGGFEAWVSRRHAVHRLEAVASRSPGVVDRVEEALRSRGLVAEVDQVGREPGDDTVTLFLTVIGSREDVRKARRILSEREDVRKVVLVGMGG